MSQETEFSKLYVKKKTYKIPTKPKEGEVQALITITPLDLKQSNDFEEDKDASKEEKIKKTMEMMSISLDMPVEEIQKISVAHMKDIMDAIFDANNIDNEQQKSIKKILDSKTKTTDESSK